MKWLEAFCGTPQRLMWTLAILLGISIVIYPPLLAMILNNIAQAIGPVLGPIMTLLLVIGAFKIMVSGWSELFKGGGKKR